MRLFRLFVRPRHVGVSLLLLVVSLTVGCDSTSFLDPGEMAPGKNYQRQPLLKPILHSLQSGIEEPNDQFANAEEARPEDSVVESKDYLIGKSDLLSISISDLVGPGVETLKQTRVTESGNVFLPMIGEIKAEGLTEATLTQAIVKAYKDANIVQQAQVTVIVTEARARTFSILGSVTRPNEYAIIKSDFRILDALVLAGDINSQGVEYIYVIRQADTPKAKASEGEKKPEAPSDSLAPRSQGVTMPSGRVALMADIEPAATKPAVSADKTNDSGEIIVDGKSMPAVPVDPKAVKPVPTLKAPVVESKPFEFTEPTATATQRIIRIPVTSLKNGELKYNIVVRPRDMIVAPNPTIGEYYMGGHVAATGVYSLTGRDITLKQAIVAARMLDGVAIPQRTEVIRRIGRDKEVFCRVDLAKVFAGDQPDIFLKPNDVVMVGTNFFAPFIASLRGGFRITYGFGFLYDRNFAPVQRVN